MARKKKAKQSKDVWPTQTRYFSKDMLTFLSYLEYEVAPQTEGCIKNGLSKKGAQIRDLGYVLVSAKNLNFIDVNKSDGIKIKERGLMELQKLRSNIFSEKQTKIQETQTNFNQIIAYTGLVIAVVTSIRFLIEYIGTPKTISIGLIIILVVVIPLGFLVKSMYDLMFSKK